MEKGVEREMLGAQLQTNDSCTSCAAGAGSKRWCDARTLLLSWMWLLLTQGCAGRDCAPAPAGTRAGTGRRATPPTGRAAATSSGPT